MIIRIFTTAIITILSVTFLFGQNQETISGKVIDQNGAAISGASVKVESNSGEKKTIVTNSDGEFSLSGLSGGNYR